MGQAEAMAHGSMMIYPIKMVIYPLKMVIYPLKMVIYPFKMVILYSHVEESEGIFFWGVNINTYCYRTMGEGHQRGMKRSRHLNRIIFVHIYGYWMMIFPHV